MIKKISMFAMIVLSLTCLAGCGGGGGGSSSGGGDQTVTDSGILTLLSNYEKVVEAYQVKDMLDCLDSGSFTLTINEGSYTDTKDYNTLKKELEDDEASQLAWREPSTVTGGHNYKLDLKLGTPTSSNATSSGAVVKQTFEVWESSDEVTPAIETDSGNIVWTLVQNSGEWKATAMVINYNYSTTKSAALVTKGLAATSSAGKGFGFGKVGY